MYRPEAATLDQLKKKVLEYGRWKDEVMGITQEAFDKLERDSENDFNEFLRLLLLAMFGSLQKYNLGHRSRFGAVPIPYERRHQLYRSIATYLNGTHIYMTFHTLSRALSHILSNSKRNKYTMLYAIM